MFDNLTTKLALRRVGLPTSMPAMSIPTMPAFDTSKMPAMPAVTNPFANTNFTLPKNLPAWAGGSAGTEADAAGGEVMMQIAEAPKMGDMAPSGLALQFPRQDGRPCLLVFLRFCGCPFAARALLTARSLSTTHPKLPIILISHCTPASTRLWLDSLGGPGSLQIMYDKTPAHELYAAWGLGQSNTWYLMNPWTQNEMRKLGAERDIGAAGRGVQDLREGGDRWLKGGYWAVDGRGRVVCGGMCERAEEEYGLWGAANVLGFRGV